MPAAATNPTGPTGKPPQKSSNSYWQQTAQNRMLMVVLAMVVLVPLLALPTNTATQGLANYALRMMAALLAGILVLRGRIATKKSDVMTFVATGANLAVLLFFADTVISLLLSTRNILYSSAVDFMRVLTGVLLYFALAYHIRRSEHLTKIQDSLVLIAALISSFGLANLATSSRDPQVHALTSSLFGDHQLYGAMMMMLFPMTLVAAITEKQQMRQIIAQVVAAITFICLILSQTRTSWLGGIAEVIALLIFTLIKPKRNNTQERKVQYIVPVLIVIACGGMFMALGGANSAMFARFNSESSKEATDYRYKMWYAAEEMIKRSPLIGNGLGSYARDQESYTHNGRTIQRQTSQNSLPSLGEMAHNFWLQTAAEQGILGAGLFAAILLSFLVAGIRRLRFLDGGIRRWLLLASMSAIIGFAVDAIGNPAWQFAQISMFFWLMLGSGRGGPAPAQSARRKLRWSR